MIRVRAPVEVGSVCRQELVRQVLENVVRTVGARTRFQRAAATCYDPPVLAGEPTPSAAIVEVAAYGLSGEQLSLIHI